MFDAYRGKGRYFLFPLACGVLTVVSFFVSAFDHPITPIPWYNNAPWWDWGFSVLTVMLLLLTVGVFGIMLVSLAPPRWMGDKEGLPVLTLERATARQIAPAARTARPSITTASPVRNGGRAHSGVGGPPHTGAPGPHPVPNCAVTVGQTSMA